MLTEQEDYKMERVGRIYVTIWLVGVYGIVEGSDDFSDEFADRDMWVGDATENLALLLKLTLKLLRHDPTIKDTMRRKRILDARCKKTLEILLKLNNSK
jgi:hypothetical protein